MIKPTSSDKLADEYCFYRFILHIIPVIDLLNGMVVHAKEGNRTQYLPTNSPLCQSSKPLDIVKAFMAIYPFKTLYIADLNAIQGIVNKTKPHSQIVEDIHAHFPELTIWLDAGINTTKKVKAWAYPYTKLVLGSESFETISQYESITSQLEQSFTLSIDFLPNGYTGPPALLENYVHWPKDIIAMTLANVGANTGVDTQTIKKLLTKAKTHRIYAAGGIRHVKDLLALKQLGVKGALIASALHNQQINTADIEKLHT